MGQRRSWVACGALVRERRDQRKELAEVSSRWGLGRAVLTRRALRQGHMWALIGRRPVRPRAVMQVPECFRFIDTRILNGGSGRAHTFPGPMGLADRVHSTLVGPGRLCAACGRGVGIARGHIHRPQGGTVVRYTEPGGVRGQGTEVWADVLSTRSTSCPVGTRRRNWVAYWAAARSCSGGKLGKAQFIMPEVGRLG